jgi:hypothetical protein
VKAIENLEPDDMILDLGPTSVAALKIIIGRAGTIVWNGPVGVFEFDAFAAGTRALAEAIATSGAFSIAGGGDTIAAINKFGVTERISYISTAGGAFLEFLEGKTPARGRNPRTAGPLTATTRHPTAPRTASENPCPCPASCLRSAASSRCCSTAAESRPTTTRTFVCSI